MNSNRRRTLILLSFAVTAVAAAVLLASNALRTVPPRALPPAGVSAADTAADGRAESRELTFSSDRLRPGETLSLVLRRNGIPDSAIDRVVRAFAREIDLRRIPAGARIELARSSPELDHVDLHLPGEHEFLRVEASGTGLDCTRLVPPSDTLLAWYEGTVETSVYESLLEGGATASLAVKFFEIFQFTHYFAVDTRAGDRYSLLVEEVWRDGDRVGYGTVLAARYTGRFDTLTAVWFERGRSAEYFDRDGYSFRRDLLRVPFPAARITSTYGYRRHPVSGRYRMHHGLDLAADRGTPVVAAGKGTVTKLGRGHPGYGNWLQIRHGNTGFETRYGHLRRFARGIHAGTKVEQGQVIGYVGSTGNATGPHLHYEVFRDRRRIDPRKVKASPVQRLEGGEYERFALEAYDPWVYLLDAGESGWRREDGFGPWPVLFADGLAVRNQGQTPVSGQR
ncbi:MAG: Murein DD-endopeptidase MepM [Calditrichaeota bacterium]|nr:Murein DD-endopeptidase MepM [Calditrichota bacterium]